MDHCSYPLALHCHPFSRDFRTRIQLLIRRHPFEKTLELINHVRDVLLLYDAKRSNPHRNGHDEHITHFVLCIDVPVALLKEAGRFCRHVFFTDNV